MKEFAEYIDTKESFNYLHQVSLRDLPGSSSPVEVTYPCLCKPDKQPKPEHLEGETSYKVVVDSYTDVYDYNRFVLRCSCNQHRELGL